MLSRATTLAALLVVAVLLAGCGVAAPDTKGMTLSQAESALESAGFEVGRVVYDEKATGAYGAVITQNPPAGERAKEGALFILTIAGAPPVTTPDLTELTEDEAKVALTAVGLAVGEVSRSYDATVPGGAVISQTPAADSEVQKGSAVFLVVSKGKEPVEVPSVKGKSEKSAREKLEAAGFEVKVRKKNSSKKKGTVIAQKPSGGKALPASTVTITVSKGVQLVTVPNVYWKDWDVARSILRRADLRPVARWSSADKGLDHTQDAYAIWQSPKAGARVPRGSRVTVEITSIVY